MRVRRKLSDYVRREVAASQQWRCATCAQLLTAAFQVDHIRPLWAAWADREDPDARDNLQALCGTCHASKTASENSGRSKTQRVVSKFFVRGTREYASVHPGAAHT